jgi:hypothetical protein
LKQKAKVWETTERKWAEALLFYKLQQEALDNQVKALTKEKKEKENVLIDFELVNLKNACILNFKELRRKTIAAEKEKLVEEKEY